MIKAMYVCIGVALLAAGISVFVANRAVAPETEIVVETPVEVMCTMDAMQCPDGSYVGRTGPNCAFECPPVATTTEKRVILNSPLPNAVVTSPLSLTGEAGGWYFEGSFPVELVDAAGNIIAQAPAIATGDWMTTDFVPFTASLSFTNPYSAGDPETEKVGKIILRKDNPSGLPENDDSIEIPVRFAP